MKKCHGRRCYCNDGACEKLEDESIGVPCKIPARYCRAKYDPVCGTDGCVYENHCEAYRHGVKIQCKGECPCEPNKPCPKNYRPVCGKDGVTYSNWCKAGKDNFQCKGKCPCKNGCPYGWSSYGSGCYQVQHSQQSWYDAEHHCQRRGAHLASIHSLDESLFVAGLDPGAMWLGGTDRNHEGHWVWSDGTPFTFTGWSWTKPDNTGGQDCLVTNFRQFPGGWDDVQCRAMKKFVCEKQNLKMYQGTKFL